MEQQKNYNTFTMLDWALFYREKLQWSIIPVAKDKRPLVNWKNYQEVTASVEEIREWWNKFPEANIGVVTGRISNLIVVDIDPRHGGSDELFKSIETVKAKTGGGGWHYFFKYEEGIKNFAAIKSGIDIRSEGGFVVIAPSIHQSGNKYEWEVQPYE